MKISKYNYCIPFENKYIFFNGISKKFIIVSQSIKDKVDIFINNSALCQKQSPLFFQKLREIGLIIEDNVNELDIIRTKHLQYKNAEHYLLIILPTYSCNFACWYCTQNHKEEFMTSETQEYIKNHIAKYLLNNHIKRFELSWFGGEPLLCFSTIKNITKFAQSFCMKHNISFSNGITTNGYFITEEYAKEMKELEIYDYQITIDGHREDHNQTRNHSGLPSFDVILKNICILCNIIPQANITLRFNYSDKNIKTSDIVQEVNSIIPHQYRNQIHILPRKIWQISAEHKRVELIKQLTDSFRKSGYQVRQREDAFICY